MSDQRPLDEETRKHKRTQSRFRRLVERARVIPWEASPRSGFTWVGHQAVEILGHPLDVWYADDAWERLLHPDDRDSVLEQLEKSSGSQQELEFRLVAADGRSVWVRDYICVARAGERTLEGFMFDITALKEAEQGSRDSQKLLRSAIDALEQGIALLDHEGRILTVNKSWARLAKQSCLDMDARVPGSSLLASYEASPHEEMQSFSAGVRAVLRQERAEASQEIRCVHSSSCHWYLLRIRPVEGPEAARAVVSWEDVTAARRAETALRDSMGQLQWLTEQMPAVLWSTDLDLRVRTALGAGLDLVGLDAADLQDRGLEELFGAVESELDVVPAHRRALDGESSRYRQSWADRTWECSVSPLHDGLGATVGTIGIALDVSQRERADRALRESAEQLRQAQKLEAVGRLASGVAHDFNNYLTAINGYSDLLLERMGKPEKLRDYVRRIRQAGERAKALTQQLLAIGHTQPVSPRVVNLNQLLRGLRPILAPLLGEGTQVHYQFDPDLGNTLADPGQLEQVILNLAVNARDALPKGGRITLRTEAFVQTDDAGDSALGREPGPYTVLVVQDTGDGMDQALQERIFEPFFTTKSRGRGTGLGLSTVYGIVKQGKGWISVDSNPGEGSCFKVYLPLTDLAAGALVDDVGGPVLSLRGSETILLVEDEQLVRAYLQEFLVTNGYRVLEARGPDEALEIAKHEPLDLLLTDVVMPGSDGFQLAERLLSDRPELKVIFMSGHTGEAIIPPSALSGRAPLLAKPFSPQELGLKLREVLDRP